MTKTNKRLLFSLGAISLVAPFFAASCGQPTDEKDKNKTNPEIEMLNKAQQNFQALVSSLESSNLIDFKRNNTSLNSYYNKLKMYLDLANDLINDSNWNIEEQQKNQVFNLTRKLLAPNFQYSLLNGESASDLNVLKSLYDDTKSVSDSGIITLNKMNNDFYQSLNILKQWVNKQNVTNNDAKIAFANIDQFIKNTILNMSKLHTTENEELLNVASGTNHVHSHALINLFLETNIETKSFFEHNKQNQTIDYLKQIDEIFKKIKTSNQEFASLDKVHTLDILFKQVLNFNEFKSTFESNQQNTFTTLTRLYDVYSNIKSVDKNNLFISQNYDFLSDKQSPNSNIHNLFVNDEEYQDFLAYIKNN
ncbi:hypothetical protein [[Mycoplasma] gypis]|uniref:Lipoprotein n=1 Tax=[Mycoplasma] gypis TaxID=92404 RepID=A0ABZ2RPR1_9BACT|nr:hypothetical protein [[Mycoplasma] gypis]MBN0919486.1 hypothetical protein [[Mycoplasma] gypis]